MKILILGSNGRLGSALVRRWKTLPGVEVIALTRTQVDLSDPEKAEAGVAVEAFGSGDVVVNCAAATDVDGCERDHELARRINAESPGGIARLCAARGARLIHIGTDYVFDGSLDRPYTEEDEPKPLSHYGVTKLEGDREVLAASPSHCVVRVSWVFGPDKPSFVDAIVKRALTSPDAAAVHDKTSAPSYTEDMAVWLEAFLKPSVPGGIYHLCNSGTCSWRDYGEYALECAKANGIPVLTTTVAPLKLSDMKAFIATRPPRTPLDTGKFARITGITPRHWKEAVEEYFKTWKV
ncbi:MAG: dTDP-4-dehydrorhamnose reductase [Chthoniobacterales bacterium]